MEAMLTDALPRKNRASFLESDRIKTLNLPQDGQLPSITEFIKSAMKVGQSTGVRRACELPCQRRHDRASLDEPETRTAPSNRGRFRFPKTLDESSDFNSGTSQIVAVAKIAV
ncbi:MAG: hypothetical protein DMG97_26995 [Acidobacteria bacterium]|nr:MAG: hypothetical protein DMG97_26995 [Acidobacteriota bacterium]